MSFFRWKPRLYPIIAILASVFILIFGMVCARMPEFPYFLLGLLVWLALFGCGRACLRVLPVALIVGGIFTFLAYVSSGRDASSALAMANRFGALFLALAPGMSVEPVAMTRSLSALHTPRAVTLGMLIVMSFLPVLRAEIGRVREAMKTRGAGSPLRPRIFYRAFLIPLVTRLVDISDTLALSIETRGFTLGKAKYTVYKKEWIRISDILFAAGLAAGAVLVVLW